MRLHQANLMRAVAYPPTARNEVFANYRPPSLDGGFFMPPLGLHCGPNDQSPAPSPLPPCYPCPIFLPSAAFVTTSATLARSPHVIAPPYDVIDAEMLKAALQQAATTNSVRLILGKDEDQGDDDTNNRYTRAGQVSAKLAP